ncbi:unnamed protein product [Fusarium graminearum]|uniref:Uncharacterized protein n=1 Tax=Gibberella zeae TaxID=5518 RepID=A0A4U9EJI6_GIBZA|nr:unnamed protein product [Fusarium graminearum]CAF3613238.1 unnamed protein product [Fusarium graminearum]CAF3638160.1 unnamed protein product [Fusarium graminearum]CAG1959395.1 unnamed protein product [Fusarium graminearum]CAG1965909.1 unnamed protein product [Fusarium graminearum]
MDPHLRNVSSQFPMPLIDPPVRLGGIRCQIEYLNQINTEIRKVRPDFCMLWEYLAAALLVDERKLKAGGRLSLDTCSSLAGTRMRVPEPQHQL